MNWRIELLGELRATCGEHSIVQFRSRKTAALLAYLAFFRGSHSREKLVELFWPDCAPEAGRNSLRVALADLQRRAADVNDTGSPPPPLLEKDRASIALSRGVVTDVEEFEKAVGAARRELALEARIEVYERSRALYKGTLLPGFYEDWIPIEEARLEATFLHVLKTLGAYYEGRGDALRAFELGQLAARLEPQRSESARASSSASAKKLEEHTEQNAVYSVTPDADAVAPVPATFTRFFGREAELRDLTDVLLRGQTRLLTITGSGGLGKTRLALELAHRVERAPQEGKLGPPIGRIYWVPLADVLEAERLPESLIKALSLSAKAPEGGSANAGVLATLVRFLRKGSASTRTLLVLDNFEQLLPQGAAFLGKLLERVPHLVLLVSSRQRLNLTGEREHSIGSLSLPAAPVSSPERLEAATRWDEQQLTALRGSSSVQLFADRARSARADWRLAPREVPALVSLLHRLEGVPLAIELVASRAGVLSVEQMLSRLSQSLQWVSSRDLHRPARHRSLHAVLDWSLQLLPAPDRDIFGRLCVFHGGWTLEDATVTLADVDPGVLLDAMQNLRDASLIASSESQGGLRFSMLEIVRQLAGERLSDEECLAARRQHAEFYFGLSQTASRSEKDARGRSLWSATEGPNFLAALDFWTEFDLERALNMAASLWWYWIFNYHLPEGRHRLRELLSHPDAEQFPVARAHAQGCAAYIALLSGYYDETEQLLQITRAFWQGADNKHELVSTLNLSGALARARGDIQSAREFYEQSLDLRRGTGLPRELAISINALADLERECARPEAARALCFEVLELAKRTDDHAAEAWALQTLGRLALDEDDLATARALLEKSLLLRQRANHLHAQATCLEALGDIEARAGDLACARTKYQRALDLWRQINQLANFQTTQQKLDALS